MVNSASLVKHQIFSCNFEEFDEISRHNSFKYVHRIMYRSSKGKRSTTNKPYARDVNSESSLLKVQCLLVYKQNALLTICLIDF